MIPNHNEEGAARLKFIVVMAMAAVVLYVGYMYVPVAFQAYEFKDAMQTKVDAAATQGFNAEWVRTQLVKSEPDYGVPANAAITASTNAGRIEVHVQYTVPISFPGYTYNYEFDHTVKSGTFLSN